MRKIVSLSGGIGKQLCALPALREASKSDEVWVITAYPQLFQNEGLRVYVPNVPYLFEDVISKGRLISEDPYNLYEYYHDKIHLVQAYNLIINRSEEFLSPQPVTLTLEERDWAKKTVAALRKQGVAIGYEAAGASLRVFDGEWEDTTNRSLQKETAAFLPVRFAQHSWFNVSHVGLNHWPTASGPQGHLPTGLIECPVPEGNLRQLLAFAAQMECIVTVDSSLLHIAAAFGIPHIAIFGGTDPRQLAYPDSRVFRKESHVLEQGPWGHNPGTKGIFNQGAMQFSQDEFEILYMMITNMIGAKKAV